MSADVISLDDRRPVNPGNGAREALRDVVSMLERIPASAIEPLMDMLLAELLAAGFKVVPLDGDDAA